MSFLSVDIGIGDAVLRARDLNNALTLARFYFRRWRDYKGLSFDNGVILLYSDKKRRGNLPSSFLLFASLIIFLESQPSFHTPRV